MADENVNNVNNFTEGDVLGSSSDPSRRVVNRIADSVDNIDKQIKKSNDLLMELTRNNKNSSSSNFFSRADDRVNEPSRSSSRSSTFSMSSFKNSVKQTGSTFVEDALGGFEDAIAEKLGIKDFNDNYEKILRNVQDNLAEALGLSSDNLVRTVAKGLTEQKIKNITDSDSKMANVAKKAAGFFVDGISNSMEQGVKAYDEYLSKLDPKLSSKFSSEALTSERKKEAPSETSVPKSSTVSASSYSKIGDLYADKLIVRQQEMDTLSVGTDIVSSDSDVTSSLGDSLTDNVQEAVKDASSESNASGVVKDTLQDAGGAAKDAAMTAFKNGDDVAAVLSAGVKGLTTALKSAGPQIVVAYLVESLTNELGKFFDRASKALDKLTSGADRYEESRWAKVEAQEARLLKDTETIIQTPFKILEDAANKVYETWDSALEVINATQGYDKSGLQDLMSAYSSRLREEGLSSVIGTTDVTSMLQSILNAGLSGAVAEEFAYMATVLNEAIPTEDFTSYASSYASLASSYMALGHSQEEALQYANEQLKLFASNVLTASREVSGGFTTSLTGVSDLFAEIVKISQTAGSTDTASISSALSVVQAIAGQVSPEVGNALVSQIVSAATGGNDSNLVALRSLAGTGASNTAFLQALADNPSQVLANMFQSLSDMFDKSTDNYMEVAYSLADTFGISADALARVDWNRLVSELRTTSSSSSALAENMNLLSSGETTTSAESQRLAQINEYMIDEGLAYVLDNEAAREIQNHLWDQQLAEEMQQATYAVDFAGGALEFITSIESLLKGISNILTLNLGSLLGGVLQSGSESVALQSDIKSVLEAGKVGEGNAQALHDLTTYDVDAIQRTPSYLEFWDVPSSYRTISDIGSWAEDATIFNTNPVTIASSLLSSLSSKYQLNSSSGASSPSSMYSWGNAGKSTLDALSSPVLDYTLPGVSSTSATEQISNQTSSALSKWIDSMASFVSEGLSFQDWMSSASNYGFSDASAAMEQAGYSEQDLESAYMQEGVNQAVEQEIAFRQKEVSFWDAGLNWWNVVYPTDRDAWNEKFDVTVTSWTTLFQETVSAWNELYQNTVLAFTENLNAKYMEWSELYMDTVSETHEKLQYANNAFDNHFVNDFLYEWKDYYIGNHTHYREATNFDSSIKTINTEKNQTGEAVLALAKSLTKNYEDLADPTVQTNVLLGQILVVLQSLLTATQSGKGLTLPNALSALGLNIGTSETSNK